MNEGRCEYDDEYPTCAPTWATLRIYRDDLDPEAVSRQLQNQPTSSQKKGGLRHPLAKRPFAYKIRGWFLTSQDAVQSRDVRTAGQLLERQPVQGIATTCLERIHMLRRSW